jgi:hypothetical protein
MKSARFLPVMFIILLSSCTLDPAHLTYTNIAVNIDEKVIPSSALVNTPLSIAAHATAPDGCYSDIHFLFKEQTELHYQLVALANYESYGLCPETVLSADTVITMTPETTGDYVILTWTSPNTFDLDTIKVTEQLR